MSLLFGIEFQENLKNSVQNAENSVMILSAFTKRKALLWLGDHVPDDIDVTLVTRWQCQDLISGASDLDCFELCKKNDWHFAIDQSLHCKIYLIDSQDILIGSANLTQKGLHLSTDCNFEAGTKFNISEDYCSRLVKYVKSCTHLDWKQYEKIKHFVNQNAKPIKAANKWPEEIMSIMNSKIEFLWVKDMILKPPQYYIDNCLSEQLGIEKETFIESKLYNWLINQFRNSRKKYLSFGQITSLLHNSLLDDPKPYRTTVKELIANLFEWIRYIKPKGIGIKKFNYTEALFLNDQ